MPGVQLRRFKEDQKLKIRVNEDQKEFIKHNRLILKTHQRFKSERRNVCTEEVGKIVLYSNDVKRMQSSDSIETYG